MKTAIIFGSTTGNTEAVAEKIKDKIENAEMINVTEVNKDIFESFDLLILGTSTWGLGDIQDDWADSLNVLAESNLNDKTVAIFGLGDAEAYCDSFVDGIYDLYDAVKKAGARIIGKTSTAGYEFSSSKAVENDEFLGLVIDEDNQSEMTESRIERWVSSILQELS